MPRKAIYQRLIKADPDAVKADRRAQYARHRDKEAANHKKWAQRPEIAERRRKECSKYLSENPEAALKKTAKNILSRTMCVSNTVLPEPLVEAECLRLLLRRAIKGRSRAS